MLIYIYVNGNLFLSSYHPRFLYRDIFNSGFIHIYYSLSFLCRLIILYVRNWFCSLMLHILVIYLIYKCLCSSYYSSTVSWSSNHISSSTTVLLNMFINFRHSSYSRLCNCIVLYLIAICCSLSLHRYILFNLSLNSIYFLLFFNLYIILLYLVWLVDCFLIYFLRNCIIELRVLVFLLLAKLM